MSSEGFKVKYSLAIRVTEICDSRDKITEKLLLSKCILRHVVTEIREIHIYASFLFWTVARVSLIDPGDKLPVSSQMSNL